MSTHCSTPLVVAAVLAVGTFVSAQGSYNTLGAGCAGTGASGCASSNPNATRLKGLNQNSNIFALGVPAKRSVTILFGFELFTNARAPVVLVTLQTQIYYANAAGQPTGTPKATGTMILLPALGWYKCTFKAPLIVPANQKYFLSYTSQVGRMFFPIAATAGGIKTEHYWHPPTATAWRGRFATQEWAWRVNCAGGSSAPVLANAGVPTLGRSFSVDLSRARANVSCTALIGPGAPR